MPWFPDIANPAFCETLRLRKVILETQRPMVAGRPSVLEPGSAEFLSALAAGSNSKHLLHIGCGMSTIALAAAARATGGSLVCVDKDQGRQAVVERYAAELGLADYVNFFAEEPSKFIARRQESCFDFVLFTGEPGQYVSNFDHLRFRQAAIIVAYNALDDTTNEYIKHVRQQPGIDSSTLPVGRGIEVTKILSWEAFKTGRKPYCHCALMINDEVSNPASASGYLSEFRADVLMPTTTATHSEDAVATAANLSLATENGDYHDQESFYGSPCRDSKSLSSSSSSSASSEKALTEPEKLAELELLTNGNDSPAVSIGTSLGEENAARVADLNTRLEPDDIKIQFKNSEQQTEIKVECPDQLMLLTDITMALNEANVSVQEAKISTQDNQVEDVFYVVDGQTRNLLDLDRQELVKASILKKLSERRQMATLVNA